MDQGTTDWPTSTDDDDEHWSLRSLVEAAAGEAGVLGDPAAAAEGVFWETSSNQNVSDCGSWIGLDNGSVACLLGGHDDANQSHLFDDDDGVSVSAADRQYWAMVLVVFPLFTVFGNVLVVLSVWREKSLQSVTNYFIVSLAISDIMVALLVMPLSIYVEVNRSIWELGDATCDMWVAFDVMCCTASILNLTAISVDRFIAVTQPIKYARHKNSKRIYITLALTWVISLAISSPIALGMNYTERRLQTPTLCTFYNSDFLIYSSMGSFYIPCIVMVLLYSKIFLAIRRRAKNAAKQKKYLTTTATATSATAGTTSARNRKTETTVGQRTEVVETEKRHLSDIRRRKEEEKEKEDAKTGAGKDSHVNTVLAVKSGDFEITQMPTLAPVETTKSTPSNVDTTSGQRDFDVITTHANQESLPVYGNQTGGGSTTDWYLSPAPEDEDGGGISTVGYRPPLTVEVVGMETQKKGLGRTEAEITCHQGQQRSGGGSSGSIHSAKRRRSNNGGMKKTTTTTTTVTKFNFHFRQKPEKQQKPKRRDKGASRRERKATKTLAIVLGVFLFCWVPFFTINIINAICIRYDLFENHSVCQIDPILFSFLVWLGYMNSFLNPVIYTIFNAEFRRVFQKLLLSRCSR